MFARTEDGKLQRQRGEATPTPATETYAPDPIFSQDPMRAEAPIRRTPRSYLATMAIPFATGCSATKRTCPSPPRLRAEPSQVGVLTTSTARPSALFLRSNRSADSRPPPLESRPCLYRRRVAVRAPASDDRPQGIIEQKARSRNQSQIVPKRQSRSASAQHTAPQPITEQQRRAGSCGSAPEFNWAAWPTAGSRRSARPGLTISSLHRGHRSSQTPAVAPPAARSSSTPQ